MESNNNVPYFARVPLDDRKNYEKPTIWVDKLPQISIICAGSYSGHTGEDGGGANEDHTNWEEGNGNVSIWEEEEE